MFPGGYATSERRDRLFAMSRAELNRGRFGGMATLGVVGAFLLVAAAGVVMSGSPAPGYSGGDGVLRGYPHAPAAAWTIDDSGMPGYGGTGQIAVAGTAGDDWLVSYPSDLGRSFLLVDATTGKPRWPGPVNAGLGDCAVNDAQQVGCAVRLGGVPDGFYLVDDGHPRRTGPLDGTATVTAVGDDFLRVDQLGYRASLRTADGTLRWRRDFSGTPKPRMADGLLVVDTTDGRSAVLDATTGAVELDCADCSFDVYPRGVLAEVTAPGRESVSVYPRDENGPARRPVRTAQGMRVVPGPSTLPVLTGAGSSQVLASSGYYEVLDPHTGTGWHIADPELSKTTQPCGPLVAMRKKDHSRVFYTLADGDALGVVPPPDYLDPSRNLDYLSCVGADRATAVFAAPDALTAYDAATGRVAWQRDINGQASVVDGYLVLVEGTEITKLAPN